LDATEEAAYADLAKSKAKWVLEEAPRHRRAGRSALYISGKYLSSYGADPATGEADGKAAGKPASKRAGKADASVVGNGS